ncbi:hypothetical protein [Pseudomonas oryzihabitans]|uniref:hypothetical protein n=1 Tax=Pseudomonas oryzihabitans TaxID=47885 RepID=UPI00289AE622|nr:hypothetical protein [Pseudomonas oryzihabitans]
MSGYRFDLHQQDLLRHAIAQGGQFRARMDRAGSSIRPYINVDLTDTSIEVEVEMGGTCNTITLPRYDGANVQALAEFVEGIANGTNDSAAPVVPARAARREPAPRRISDADIVTIARLADAGGFGTLECGVQVAMHRPGKHRDDRKTSAIAVFEGKTAYMRGEVGDFVHRFPRFLLDLTA